MARTQGHARRPQQDKKTGRFIQIDPLSDEEDQESLTPYHFTGNNPIRFNDPDGKCGWCSDLYDGAVKVARVFNTYVNPLTPFVELATGKSIESDLTQDKPRMTSAGEALMVALPVLKVEGTLVKITERAMTSTGERVVVQTTEKKVTTAYKRPNNATTAEQRASVQGKPCVKCGDQAKTMVAGHKKALVKEHYETGKIDKKVMRSKEAVQPECPTWSAKEGAEMSKYSKDQKKKNGL